MLLLLPVLAAFELAESIGQQAQTPLWCSPRLQVACSGDCWFATCGAYDFKAT